MQLKIILMPRLLVISDIGPTQQFTGGLVLSNIARSLSNFYELDWFLLHEASLGDYQIDSFNQETSFNWITKPVENWSQNSLPFISAIGERISDRDFKTIWQEVHSKITQMKPHKILVVLQGQTSFKVAYNLQKSRMDFSTISWDPWIWWSKDKKVHRSFTKKVENVYSSLKTGMHIVPTMEFAERYQIPLENVVVLYPHVPLPGLVNRITKDLTRNFQGASNLNLCYAGQIYAKNEFEGLINELNHIGWKFNDLDVKLHYFGSSNIKVNPHVINHGWLDPAKLIDELSKLDIGIIAYPGANELPEVSALSFPSKFAVYCAAGLPVIYFGPRSSPVSKMIQEDAVLDLNTSLHNFENTLSYYIQNYEEIRGKASARYGQFFSQRSFDEKIRIAFSIPGNSSENFLFRHSTSLSKTHRCKNSYLSHIFLSSLSLSKHFKLQIKAYKLVKRRFLTVLFFARMISKSTVIFLIMILRHRVMKSFRGRPRK
jgi:hypothetical protein